MKLGIEPIGDVARLVDLAALDRDILPECAADGLGQRVLRFFYEDHRNP